MAGEKRNPLGPTGETVRANIQRLRAGQNLGYTKLARILEEIGRPIPELGLRRIESGDRRVDVDDLMALAVALDVSPISLLMPQVDEPVQEIAVTGVETKVRADKLWLWLSASVSGAWAPLTALSPMAFSLNAQPEWEHAKWVRVNGDD
jgi:transcriptional regulator with XRE-family HTH domain